MWVYATGRRMEIPDTELTAGGEGKIHAVPTQPETLAKILFKQYRTDERREKLKALVASPPNNRPSGPDGHRRFAWPRELLFDANNKSQFLGFTMPSIPGGATLDEFIVRGRSQFRPDPLFRVGLA